MEIFSINICCFVSIFGISSPRDPAISVSDKQFAKDVSCSVVANLLPIRIYYAYKDIKFQLSSSIIFGYVEVIP